MSHTKEITDLLHDWKSKLKFRPYELPLGDTANSMASPDPLVEAKPWTNGRWAMFNKATKKGAIFTYVGIIRWTSDIHTGNFVPEGYEAPLGLPETRIQTEPSLKCEFSYAFDTSIDCCLWDSIFEAHVTKQPGFNKAGRKRKQWQTGTQPSERDKYVISSKVFVRQTPMNTKQGGQVSVPYKVHPWIQIAMENVDKTHQIPNPEKPRYLEYDSETSVLSNLEDSQTPEFNRNDIVYMSFMLTFNISRDAWSPEIAPLELIRVGTLPDHIASATEMTSLPGMDAFERLETGSTVMLLNNKPIGPIEPTVEAPLNPLAGLIQEPKVEAPFNPGLIEPKVEAPFNPGLVEPKVEAPFNPGSIEAKVESPLNSGLGDDMNITPVSSPTKPSKRKASDDSQLVYAKRQEMDVDINPFIDQNTKVEGSVTRQKTRLKGKAGRP